MHRLFICWLSVNVQCNVLQLRERGCVNLSKRLLSLSDHKNIISALARFVDFFLGRARLCSCTSTCVYYIYIHEVLKSTLSKLLDFGVGLCLGL